jgi:hypothetical protein
MKHDILEDEAYHDEELLQRVAVLGALIITGADEARQRRTECRRPRRIYLVRSDLLPSPSIATPWPTMHEMTGRSLPQWALMKFSLYP